MDPIKQFRKCRRFQPGGTLSRKRKQDILSHLYYLDDFNDRRFEDEISPTFSKDFLDSRSDEEIDYYYNAYAKDSDYVYSPTGAGATVIGYAPLNLETYYPVGHIWYNPKKDWHYPIGHSNIYGGARGTKTMSDYDYNLLTNNCSDETRRMLETVFNKKADITGFTTPGDVRDFALDNGGQEKESHGRLVTIPMNKERFDRLKEYIEKRNQKKFEHYAQK